MKLLIVCQVVDKNHPVLGFFHRWLEVFAGQCESLQVVCLQKGEVNLPPNVTVHSLGKEEGKGRLTYIFRFLSYAYRLRTQYDSVLVHMNQEYILLGGWLFKILDKRIGMWRNHYSGSWLTDFAASFCDAIFYTSSSSYTKKFKQSQAMPIGIDESLFKPQSVSRKKDAVLYVGRLSSSKRIDIILEAMKQALSTNQNLTLTIAGGTTGQADVQYEQQLKDYVSEHSLPVTFLGPVKWDTLPTIYSAHELCINLSPPGMFDKVIGEALLCGCDIATTNKDLAYLLGKRVIDEKEPLQPLISFLQQFRYDQASVAVAAESIVSHHSLSALVRGVCTRMRRG